MLKGKKFDAFTLTRAASICSMPIMPTWAWRRAAPATLLSPTLTAMGYRKSWAPPIPTPTSYGPKEEGSSYI